MSLEQPTGPEKSKDEREFKILNEKEGNRELTPEEVVEYLSKLKEQYCVKFGEKTDAEILFPKDTKIGDIDVSGQSLETVFDKIEKVYLSKHKGHLDLSKLTKLSDDKGDLDLSKMTKLSDDDAESLFKDAKLTKLKEDLDLHLSKMTKLSDDAVEFLSKQEGKIDLPPTAGGREK